jgi:hypothetical protein
MDASGVPMALAYLTEAKFLERTGTVASPLWKCTALGVRQAKRQVKPEELDPMIWD